MTKPPSTIASPVAADGEAPPSALHAGLEAVRRPMRQAAVATSVCALLAFSSSWYMLEVYSRVVDTRSLGTLLWLTVAVLLAYALLQVQEWARGGLLQAAGEGLDAQLAPRVYDAGMAASRRRGPMGAPGAAQDLRTLREFIASPVVHAAYELPVMAVLLVALYVLHPLLGVVATAVGLLQVAVGAVTERGSGRLLREANRFAGAAQQQAERLLDGASAVRAMGMFPALHARWTMLHGRVLGLQDEASRCAGLWQSVTRLLQQVLGSAMLGLSAALLLGNRLTGGGAMLIVASILGGRAVAPIVQVVAHWPQLVAARLAWQRLERLLSTFPPEAPGMPLPPPRGHLTVEHASVITPEGASLLRDLKLEVAPGDVLTVIGPSGAGKTTLGRLLLGLVPASRGAVRLDGVDMATWPKAEVGAHLGYLPQGVELLDGSLAENICRFGEIDPGRLQQALTDADLHELVASLPEGLDTRVGPSGARLSGGQQQRVGLARAVYGRPALVVLDEPNAHLDEAGELALTSLIGRLKGLGTAFVVMTHRAGVLQVSDKLLVLMAGQAAAYGPRDEVLAKLRPAPPPSVGGAPAAAPALERVRS